MSVKVDLDQLADALTDYTFAYLVTVDDGYHSTYRRGRPRPCRRRDRRRTRRRQYPPESGRPQRRHARLAARTARRLHADRRRQGPTRLRPTPRCRSCRAARCCIGRRLRGPRRNPAARTTACRSKSMSVTKKPGSPPFWGGSRALFRRRGLRSPCRPYHRSGRRRVRRPSPACLRRPPRSSGTAPRWTPRSAAPSASP